MTHTPICLGCRYYLGHPSYRIHGCRWDGLGHTFMSPIYVAHQGQTLLFFSATMTSCSRWHAADSRAIERLRDATL